MNQIEFDLLEKICSSPVPLEFDTDDPEIRCALSSLKARGCVLSYICGEWAPTDAGCAALSEQRTLNEQRQQQQAAEKAKAEEEKRLLKSNRRHDWFVAIISALFTGAFLLVLELVLGKSIFDFLR